MLITNSSLTRCVVGLDVPEDAEGGRFRSETGLANHRAALLGNVNRQTCRPTFTSAIVASPSMPASYCESTSYVVDSLCALTLPQGHLQAGGMARLRKMPAHVHMGTYSTHSTRCLEPKRQQRLCNKSIIHKPQAPHQVYQIKICYPTPIFGTSQIMTTLPTLC